MRRRALAWQILIPVLGILLAAVALATAVSVHVTRQFQLEETEQLLETHARLAAYQFEGTYDAGDLKSACAELGRLTGSRFTLIAPSGQVLGDSNEDPAIMDNHENRAEVVAALTGQVGRARRYSHTLHNDCLYVAVPVLKEDKVVAVVRASRSLASINAVLRRVIWHQIASTLIVVVLASLAVLGVSRRITRPLQRMVSGVRRFGQQGMQARLEIPNSAELAELAEAMNRLAGQLEQRIEWMDRQRSELDAVLMSMSEGIVAVDHEESIVRMNAAACKLFNTTPDAVRGRALQEVARNTKLQECVRKILAGEKALVQEVVFGGEEERLLRVSATRLESEEGQVLGTLLVLDDISQLRALERMRSDFVANVSHEIRTPVTSIKGYAETLASDKTQAPETVDRFLQVIVRQSDRLCALVDDILALSNLERREVTGEVTMEEVDVLGLLEAAARALELKALSKGIRLQVSCPEALCVKGDAGLLEQGVSNLIDNAIKYSSPNGRVEVSAEGVGDMVAVHVLDEGVGISPEHLPRIFERFYRVDRARSRSVGGTGLGLAIVKHVAVLHGGTVTVASTPGKGSQFTLCLPVRQDVF